VKAEMKTPDQSKVILNKVESDVAKKLAEKESWRKKVKDDLGILRRKLLRLIFADTALKVKQFDQGSPFGYDKLGRDVNDGLQKYVRFLFDRNLRVNSLVVMGSRVKGSWTASSDIDVLIVADGLPPEGTNLITRRLFRLRRSLLLSDRPLFLGIEPSGCCSRSEFLTRLRCFDLQTLDAVLYGQVVYDDGFWHVVTEQYRKMEFEYSLNRSFLKELLAKV
jgi:predicted nucleotidyltransferase